MSPILDGEFVESKIISPSKHKYIGMWRGPFQVPNGYIACSCGSILQTFEMTRVHYQLGHFDEPQYVSIDGDKIK